MHLRLSVLYFGEEFESKCPVMALETMGIIVGELLPLDPT